MSSGCVTSISDTNIPTPTPAKTAAAAAAMLPSLAPSSTRGGGGGGSGGGGGGGGTGGSGVSTSASTAPGSGATTPGSSSRIPLPRHLNGLGGGVRRSASMRLRGEKYHQLLGAGASAASLASFYSSSSSAAASPRTRASASAASLWGSGGGGPRGAGGDARQCPSISEGASWRALRPGATAAQRGAAHDPNGHPAPAAGAGAAAGRYYRSLSLTGGGSGSGGPAFPSAPAASPDPGASGPAPGRQQPQPPPRRGRGASLSFCPVDDQLLLDDVLDAVGHPGAGGAEEQEDDASSLRSFGSACSAMSCDHAYFARNGTTFSGRRMKYVVHCSPHAGETEEYLTPTQRAARQIRRLKTLLQEAQREINQKDQDIFRLTKEVVELRLFKASLGASSTRDEDDEVGDSTTHKIQDTGIYGKRGGGGGGGDCEAALVDEADAVRAGARAAVKALAEHLQEQEALAEEDSPRALLLHLHTSDRASSHGGEKTSSPSLADSGHFEDIVTTPEPHARGLVPALASPSSPTAPSSQQQQQQPPPSPQTQRAGAVTVAGTQAHVEVEALRLRLSEEATVHVRELQQQKERHNDRVEALLQRLSDANDQYCELRTEYERAQDKIRQLEKEAESLRKNMEEHEERHKSMYLKMYMKGQEAARFEHADQVLEFAHKAPSRVSVPELLQQLQVAESELENMKQETDLRHTLAPKSALLSAREALSLWLLGTRKAMYRRIVESRAKKGELDPEITLQFLKSAIYYFLTDKENHQGHLNAIESILGYNENEKLNIEKAYRLYVRK